MPNPPEIVAGLSEEMKRAIGPEAWISSDRKLCCAGTTATIRALQKRRLADRIYRLTPLGLAVRAHLLEHPNAD